MIKKIDKNNEIEFYGVKPKNYDSKKLILIPFYQYKIYAPKPVRSTLNIFQKAILSIFKSKRLENDKIRDLTGFDIELIRLIISELLASQYLDNNKTITQRGKDILEKELIDIDLENDEYTYGYVYQNPFNLDFFSFFNTQQERADIIKYNEQGYPIIEIGTKGEPYQPFLNILFPKVIKQPVTPDAEQIINVVKKHKRILNNTSYLSDAEEDDKVDSAKNQYINKLGKISIINEEPDCIYLATYIYVPNEANDWEILHPFGLQKNSQSLKILIKANYRKQKQFKDITDKLLGKSNEREQKQKDEVYQKMYDDAKIEIENRLGSDFLTNSLFHTLLSLEKNYNSKDYKYIPIEAQQIGETIFSEIWGQNKTILKVIITSNDRTIIREKVNAFLNLGYKIKSPHSVIVDARQIRNYIQKGQGSLRAKLAGALLCSVDNKDFILNKILTDNQNTLGNLDNIAKIRNKYAHGSISKKDNASLKSDVEKIREDIYSFIKLYLKNI